MPNNEHKITLGVLNAVHDDSNITQRSMAGELGIALDLTNFYLKRCIKTVYFLVPVKSYSTKVMP
jgi:hypothetical protein